MASNFIAKTSQRRTAKCLKNSILFTLWYGHPSQQRDDIQSVFMFCKFAKSKSDGQHNDRLNWMRSAIGFYFITPSPCSKASPAIVSCALMDFYLNWCVCVRAQKVRRSINIVQCIWIYLIAFIHLTRALFMHIVHVVVLLFSNKIFYSFWW